MKRADVAVKTLPKTLTIYQVMDLLQVGRRTVQNWMKAGKVEVVRTPGGRPRIVASSLLKPDE